MVRAVWYVARLAVFLAVLVLGSPSPHAETAPLPCEGACAAARAKVAALVAAFEAGAAHYTSPAFSEGQTRARFIDPFFEALGYDPANRAGAPLFRRDAVPEARLRIGPSTRFADYALRLDARTIFFVEAKAAHQSLDDPAHVFQAKRYAWSSTHADLAVLTDFQELRVFDARLRPDLARPGAGAMHKLRFSYRDYVSRFPEVWAALAKRSVANDSIPRLLAANDDAAKVPVDRAFLADLEAFRLDLGRRAVLAANPDLSAEALNAAATHVLNQVVFARILEDRDIEPTGRLREALIAWCEGGAKPGGLWDALKVEFKRLARRYRGVVFRPHPADELSVPDTALADILEALYPPRSPYAFDAIPVEVLGRAFEGYLGKRLEIAKGEVKLAPRPEVRAAGGVFYTPAGWPSTSWTGCWSRAWPACPRPSCATCACSIPPAAPAPSPSRWPRACSTRRSPGTWTTPRRSRTRAASSPRPTSSTTAPGSSPRRSSAIS
jgi:hypothetical protein